ncbi:UbiA family prenyltransferase [Uniformispora flossi]|uniref:UbiA family prenyltransferase n=1 Tax=Uniformispora flossi TaxID=3390723 RepID=UPI003C2BB7BF
MSDSSGFLGFSSRFGFVNGYPPPAVRLPAIRATARRTARASRALAGACHPLPTVAVTALVTAVAAAAGRGASGTAAVALAVLAGQLSVGWANDALDARRDAAVGRVDKPAAGGALAPRVVAVAAATALVLCVPLSLLSGTRAAAAHLTGVVGGGWAYNLGLKATWWSPLPYAIGFASLPAFVALGLPGHPWPAWWAVLGAALLGVGAHLVNVLPDLADDQATGIAGLPHRIGATWSRRCAAIVLAAALAVIAFGPPGSRELSSGTQVLVVMGVAGGVAVGGVAWLLLFRQRSGGENVTPSSRASDRSVRTRADIRTDDTATASAHPQIRTPTTPSRPGLATPRTDTTTTLTGSTVAAPRTRTATTPPPEDVAPQAVAATTAATSTHAQPLSGITPSPSPATPPHPSTPQAIVAAPPASPPGTASDAPQESAAPRGNTADAQGGASTESAAGVAAANPATGAATPMTPADSDAPTPPAIPGAPHLGSAAQDLRSPERRQDPASATLTETTPPVRRDQLPFRIAIAIAALAVILLIAHGGQIA